MNQKQAIEETTVSGSVDAIGEITFNEKLNLSKKAEDICAYKDYVFILNSDKNEIYVYFTL